MRDDHDDGPAGAGQRPAGRPRSQEARRAILEATVDLLKEVGYEHLTMQAVADRAEVGKPTVYRRWSSKPELVMAAMEQALDDAGTVTPTGDLRADLTAVVDRLRRLLLEDRVACAIPGLVAVSQSDPGLTEVLRERFLPARRAPVRAIVEASAAAGELREGVDVDLVLDLLVGALYLRLLVTGAPLDDPDLPDRLVGALLDGILAQP